MLPLGYARGRLVVGTRVEEKSDLWSLQFDADSGDVSFAEPELLISGVDYAAVATDGTVVYLPQIEVPEVVVLVNSQGEELQRYGEPQPHLSFPTLSPDGNRLAVVTRDIELWVHDIERNTATRLARDEAGVVDPQWTPDSRTLYYSAGYTSKLRRIRADPGAEIETVHEDAFRSFLAPDGSGVLINQGGFQLEKAGGLHWFPLDEEGKLGEGRQILTGFDIFGRLSPDGRMIAYRVRTEDQEETYLATFPDADQTIQLSSGGGFTPRWSRDSETVHYFSRGSLIKVDVGFDAAGRLRASPEMPLFDLDETGLSWHWSSTPEGFLFVKPLKTDEPQEIVVRQHALARPGD